MTFNRRLIAGCLAQAVVQMSLSVVTGQIPMAVVIGILVNLFVLIVMGSSK